MRRITWMLVAPQKRISSKANLSWKILPRRVRDDQPEGSRIIPDGADFQPAAAHPPRQVFNLVERLNRGGGIIYRGRERSNRDIHQQTDSVCWSLLKSPPLARLERLLPSLFPDLLSPAHDPQQKRTLDQGVSDGRNYFDDPS
jgi:hypothetical protein